MRTKGIIGLAAPMAAVVGLEAYNRHVVFPRERLEWQLPAEPTTWRWRFGDVAVYESGDPANPPLLLLHGQNAAASAFEMREPFTRFSDRFHVYAPDLFGYGYSDRPNIEYTPQLYIEFIEDILREVVQRPANVLASSLTSAYAIQAAANSPEWISSLALVCPTGVRSLTEQSSAGRLVEAMLNLPIIGQAVYNGIASYPSIRYFLETQTYFDATQVTDGMVESYYHTSHVPGARYAPSAFVSGKLYYDASDAWTRLEQRVLLVWGKEAKVTPVSDGAAFLATNPGAELQEIGAAGVLPHDEQPQQFANIVGAWLER